MITLRNTTSGALVMAIAGALILPTAGFASEAPIKEIVASHVGGDINRTKVEEGAPQLERNLCVVPGNDVCQPAREGSGASEFTTARGVAGGAAPQGNVYVVESVNHRVQEFSASGSFIAMFGWDVNRTKVEEGAPQSERNFCTQESGDICQAGVEGAAPGHFNASQSIAVDGAKGDDFYVAEVVFGESGGQFAFGERIQKFTSDGRFLLEIGKEVNKTSHGNLCKAEEAEQGTVCGGPTLTTSLQLGSTSEPGVFAYGSDLGGILAVGGPEDLLYVGDEHSLQEFRPDGTWAGEPATKAAKISARLAEISAEPGQDVTQVEVDAAGNVFLYYPVAGANVVVREFDAGGAEIDALSVPGNPNIGGMALDPFGRLALAENEAGQLHGRLYEVNNGHLHLLTEFPNEGAEDLAFNAGDQLYAVGSRELVAYRPVSVAELIAEPASCNEGGEQETLVTLDCALNGTVNPENVAGTEAWFQWGVSCLTLDNETPTQKVPTGESPSPVAAIVEAIKPNETLCFRVVALDSNVQAPELLSSESIQFTTPTVAPRIIGEPVASFVKSASAVMSGKLNPENADVRYAFEYGPCQENLEEKCASSPYPLETPAGESAAYAKINATLEATGLQPGALYHFRLMATNGSAQVGTGTEGRLTTAPTPVPVAMTESPSAVGATSATIVGTVNADGQPSVYAFEAGVYKGAETQYEVVFTGSTGASASTTQQSVTLTGLQPETEYAYRIVVRSGFGSAAGGNVVFKTGPLALVLPTQFTPPPLSVPPIEFPMRSERCKRGFKLDKHRKCVKARRSKKTSKRRRGRRK
jgi:hypothetical protein